VCQESLAFKPFFTINNVPILRSTGIVQIHMHVGAFERAGTSSFFAYHGVSRAAPNGEECVGRRDRPRTALFQPGHLKCAHAPRGYKMIYLICLRVGSQARCMRPAAGCRRNWPYPIRGLHARSDGLSRLFKFHNPKALPFFNHPQAWQTVGQARRLSRRRAAGRAVRREGVYRC
jgi:hypothetical protein